MDELKEPSKSQEDLVGLSHSVTLNKIHTVMDAITRKKPRYTMNRLTEENWFAWFIKSLLRGDRTYYEYPDYSQVLNDNGVYPLQTNNPSGEISVGLLSDWASDTAESQNIASLLGVQDYSIHMGDTYYVGSESEIADNFADDNGAPWNYGTIGSFAMLGNHEMYTGGRAYFTKLLPFMGMYYHNQRNPVVTQKASFFCLQNEYWKIVCLDTGYDSLRRFFNVLPNKKLELGDKQIAWLKNIVFADPTDKRGIIILSHHQIFSAFSEEYQRPMESLSPLIGTNRTVLWFCGHEHRMAVYGANPMPFSSTCFLRLIGHSGMPVETKKNIPKSVNVTDIANRNLVLYDNRLRMSLNKKVDLGHNGYVVLNLLKETLRADYYDDALDGPLDDKSDKLAPRKILTETWIINKQTGSLNGISITDLTTIAAKSLERSQDINKAIGK